MVTNMFNDIRLFMIVRQVCSWKHLFTSEKIMGTEETPYGVCFSYALWVKKWP